MSDCRSNEEDTLQPKPSIPVTDVKSPPRGTTESLETTKKMLQEQFEDPNPSSDKSSTSNKSNGSSNTQGKDKRGHTGKHPMVNSVDGVALDNGISKDKKDEDELSISSFNSQKSTRSYSEVVKGTQVGNHAGKTISTEEPEDKQGLEVGKRSKEVLTPEEVQAKMMKEGSSKDGKEHPISTFNRLWLWGPIS